jgi:hypothetical protein
MGLMDVLLKSCGYDFCERHDRLLDSDMVIMQIPSWIRPDQIAKPIVKRPGAKVDVYCAETL